MLHTTPSLAEEFAFHTRRFISSDPDRMNLLSSDHWTAITRCIRFVWYTSLEAKTTTHSNTTSIWQFRLPWNSITAIIP